MSQTPITPNPRARQALRRTLWLVAFTVVLVIFSYGWNVTRIDFNVPQQPQRQQNVGNALRELLAPNVLTQDYDVRNTTLPFRMGCSDNFPPPTPDSAEGEPYIVATPHCGKSNDLITIEGYNFAPNGLARLNWIGSDGERRIRQIAGTTNDNFVVGADGTFRVQISVPRIRGSAGKMQAIEAQGRFPVGAPRLSDTTYLVLEKMLETIFLALIATAVSILPSVILSFFAAGNLMHPIRIPLGNLLVMFSLFPVGAWAGSVLLGALGQGAFALGSSEVGVLLAVGALFLAFALPRLPFFKADEDGKPKPVHPLRGALTSLAFALIVIAVIGALGGLGVLFGRVTAGTGVDFVGKFFSSLGQLISLLIVPIGGVVGAFTLSSTGVTLLRRPLKEANEGISTLLGALLGGLCGAILLGMSASIAMSASWFGLLTPIIAASLAGSILPALYRSYVLKARRPQQNERLLMNALSWAGAIVGFLLVFGALNVGRNMIEGSVPQREIAFAFMGLEVFAYVAQAMGMGAILGALAGALAGTQANFPLGDTLYSTTRTILNALRSIEPLIMGLVFVIWVGIGPFAGVLALALHSIASLGKLYSEQIENIDAGPIEALESTGANRLQTMMYAVVPQIIPPYIAFTMYRWDINVRMSTIIGFVGGGGIGFLLQQQINLLRYRDAGVAVLAIAIVVSVLDYASASLRQRVG
jgi:phosphonate ABC transporter permease subunit PhnE